MTSTPITIRKSECLDDWYLIERRDHDGRYWERRTGSFSTEWCKSARFSDNADVEGNASEMLGIADAIERRVSFEAKRCAVWFDGDRVLFSSPRNSREPGVTTIEDADNLARDIRSMLGQEKAT